MRDNYMLPKHLVDGSIQNEGNWSGFKPMVGTEHKERIIILHSFF